MPKEVRVDAFVPLPAEQVAERLAAVTQRRLFVSGSRVLFVRTDLLLAGRISAKRIALAANGRRIRGVIPVLHAELRAERGGTRIVGYAGVPRWLVWYLRGVFLLLAGYLLAVAAHVLPVLPVWLPLALVGTVAWVAFVIGWQIHHAEQDIPELLERFERALGATTPAEATKTADRHRARQREPER